MIFGGYYLDKETG